MNRGKVTVSGSSDGQKTSIHFQDMDVELPIVSVRKCVKAGKGVRFFGDGGEMRDRATGKTIRIYELDSTYFMKINVDLPEHQDLLLNPPPFHRPGL